MNSPLELTESEIHALALCIIMAEEEGLYLFGRGKENAEDNLLKLKNAVYKWGVLGIINKDDYWKLVDILDNGS